MSVDTFTAKIGSAWLEEVVECWVCEGTGKCRDLQSANFRGTCNYCRGSGKITKAISLEDAMQRLAPQEVKDGD